MEICRCLNDIIQDVEKQNNIIVRARTCHGTLILIDLMHLKNNPRLDGAEVFKMLFGISDTNPFGRFPMEKDEEGCLTILRDLQITSNQWYIFNVFLNTGSVPGYDDYKLGRIAVLKEYRGNGIGTKILKHLELIAKDKKVNQIILEAQSDKLNFYLKENYIIEGDKYLMDGIYHNLMSKKL